MNSKTAMIRLAATGMIAFSLSLGACGDIERGETTPPAKATDNGATPTTDGTSTPTTDGTVAGLSFEADVHPILMAKCSGCHTATHGSAYKLTGDPATDQPVVTALVTPGDAAGSSLIQKSSAVVAHGGGAALKPGTPEYDTVSTWITEGALNP